MRSRSIGWGLVLALVMALLLALPASAADYDPITTSSACVPKTLVEPGEVEVTIKVYNGGEEDMQSPMTLYDPDGNAVSDFTDVTLKAKQSQSWNGTWNVTKEQMEEGKLRFALRYELSAGEGDPVQVNKTIAVAIQQDAPTPKLTASYSVTPNPAQAGQEVVLTYTLSNTGNVAVTNVQITNTKLTNDKINVSRIEPGDKVTREYTYTMGKKKVTFKPKVTYRAEGSDKVLTIANMAQKTLEVATGGLDLTLTGENVTGVMPGDKAKLVLKLKNTGNITYTGMQITDSVLGVIESGLEIKPGEEKTVEKEFTVQESADHSFTVTGDSSAGGTIENASNKVSVVALDTDRALNLEVTAQAGQTVIRDKPATVAFAVTVKNIGTVDGANIDLYQGKTKVATIESLPAGEEAQIVREFTVSMEGTFQFTAVYKLQVEGQEEAVEQRFSSPELMIAYVAPTAEPVTPPPTIAPIVTLEPEPTAAPEKTGSIGLTILYVVAGLLVVALAAVLVLILAGRRKSSGTHAAAMDGFERGGSRRYTSRPGAQRRRRPQRERVDLGDVEREDWGEDAREAQALDASVEEEADEGSERPQRGRTRPLEDAAGQRPEDGEAEAEADDDAQASAADEPSSDGAEEDEDDYDEEPARPARERTALRAGKQGAAKEKKGLFGGLFGKKKSADDFIDDYEDDYEEEGAEQPETPPEDMDKTVLYDRELLSRIRESAKKEGELSEQDKLLMQGGTGSYRLTRSEPKAIPAKKTDDEWLDDGPYEEDPYEDGEPDAKRGRRRK